MGGLAQQLSQLLVNRQLVFLLITWSLFWKGLALWKAAGKRQLVWFVTFLLLNTVGLLEIAYIYYLNKWDIGGKKVLSFLEENFGKLKKS